MTNNMTDYEKERQCFQWDVPEYFNFATDVVDKWAGNPDKLAMLWVDEHDREVKRTFKDFKDRSCQLANLLSEKGVQPGDVVILIMPRYIEWWESFLACLRVGAIVSPGTVQLTAKDLAYRIKTARAVALITDEKTAAKVDEIKDIIPTVKFKVVVGEPREGWLHYQSSIEKYPAQFSAVKTKSTDGAILFFTSGTTGNPKMTLHTHASYPYAHKVTGKYWLDLTPDDLHWNLSDTGWGKAAWSSLFGPWHQGAALFVHHEKRFNTKRCLEVLQKYPITTFCGAPTNYRMLVLEDLSQYKFPTLRSCTGAGEPLNPEVIEIWKNHTGLTIRDGYGQTETVLVVGNFPCLPVKPGAMGKPAPGFEVEVIDDAGNVLPPGKEGDIAIRVTPARPAGLFKEYWQEPERTQRCFRGDWYITGDRAVKDEDGYFWFVGRADDVILASGYRIGPFEVESALIEHDAVAESAVVASPDDLRGEIVKAFVVLAEGYQPSPQLVKELQDHVKKVTAPYKYPREIEFVDALPKTVSGKIRRVQLREMEWAKKGKKR
ncbi:AMP-binding protein [Desulforamulus hydrothermalis]|uniref:Acyl-coenzyme A synthetase ACSM3,mitochondrial n=1 Tax=Desulforamulus hydrothermalis Lam5 = DSM 18033 TaxID=1121428 RepID=K8ELJ8_9FIRM|nr:AMP-binding protein [Desulforamulus hydrothermalis]CCO09356.1 Acyl-coenzyme A synthetase ACSM3,mitochondrial [Desulforamulus hydrothermalis Lam5 = DSM 18033]SHH32325.1 medium-chain acyl-CoA synthetase [Desulforamulus hydrothermalis Lam5 = DSM 18033]